MLGNSLNRWFTPVRAEARRLWIRPGQSRLSCTHFDVTGVHLMDHMIHLFLMNKNHTPERRQAVLFERDPLVRERACALLRGEGFATCAVDDVALFGELRDRLAFELHVVGVGAADELESIEGLAEVEPLLVLAPLAGARRSAHFRVALPHATLVDRELRDAEALRGALGPRPVAPAEAVPDAVRRAFEPFRLTERQLEVTRHALLGESSRQIAASLFISEPTVRNHLHAIYDRAGVSGRRELLGRFVRGLLEPEGALPGPAAP